jgi:hypothetical protein
MPVSLPLESLKVSVTNSSPSPFNKLLLSETTFSSAPIAKVEPNENVVLSSLSAKNRWKLIARKHPTEFWASVISVVIAAFVLVRAFWSFLSVIGSALIQTAHAEGKDAVISLDSLGISIQTFVAVLMAIVLMWFMGMVSMATAAEKITLARDGIKTLMGFFTGLVTGAGTR